MITCELILALVMIIALTFYALMGGADYGGGVWDLLASGPRAESQRKAVSDAIGPIWEANHVWLILVVVVLFSAFPSAFSLMTTVLHIPLTLILVGIVLRGTAFTFRTYDSHDDAVQAFWSRIFSIASLVTPVLLGVAVGAISSGSIHPATQGNFYTVYVHPWCQPFPFSVGIMALTLFAYLAAVYLCAEVKDPALQDDFRFRSLWTAGLLALSALAVFLLARTGAPDIFATLTDSWLVHAGTAVTALVAVFALVKRKFSLARTCAASQATLILWGWAVAQYPFLIRPEVTIFTASSHSATLSMMVVVLSLGSLVLFPSFIYLFKVFKGAGGEDTDLEH